MGFFDGAIAQQDGGGMLGGLPATWQYQNPETLTPDQRKLMALVGSQNPDQAGFNPLPNAPGAFPAGGAAPIAGTDSPFGMLPQSIQAPAAPFANGGDPMAGTGSGNDGGLPIAPPMPPISSDNSAPAVAQAAPMAAPPAPTFGAGAAPIFATAPGSTPGNPALPAPLAKSAPVVAADDGEEDAPASPLKVGNVQMPRIGSAASFTPDPAALPANAQPTQGFAVPGAPGTDAAPSIGDKLMAGYQNLHHGGGLIGSIVAAVAGKRNDPSGVALQQQAQIANMTARALMNKGVSQDMALAAVQPGNGELLKSLLTQAFAQGTYAQETDKDGNIWNVNKQTGQRTIALAAKDDKFQHFTTKNFDGTETPHVFNTKTGEDKISGSASGASGAPGSGSILAPGMTYDANKSGEEYLAQFSPDVIAAAKAYINGDVMPTGNARKNTIATYAKTVAQRYGQDMGIPVSDNTYAAKRKMKTDLASSGNSTMGGILSNGESAFKHLAEYSKSAADQGNVSYNFPLGGVLAHAQNYIGNSGGGSDTQGKVKALNDNLGHYGQESTKFYAGTGGGVEERMHALKELNATSTSGEEAASYAEKEKSLMLDRLNSKLQEIRNTLGEEEGNREIAKHMPDIQKHMDMIDANIAKLRNQAPATAAETAASIPKLDVGQSTTVNGVSIKKVSDAQAGK